MDKKIISLIIAVLLFLCLFNMPYGYYQLVRFIAMVGFAYLGYTGYEQSNKNEVFIFIALAILFQPFFKIMLGRAIWNIVDVLVGVGLLLSILKKKK